jgi:hypothetical protein
MRRCLFTYFAIIMRRMVCTGSPPPLIVLDRPMAKPQTILTRAFSLLLCFFTCLPSVHGQTDSSVWEKPPEISYSGYIDIYYAYDFNTPTTDYRQPFLYNHNRHNEFSLNHSFIKVSARHSNYRANVALQAGTYVMDAYALEPAGLQYMYEANVGLSLTTNNTLWFDAGIFGSHIGFESVISMDSWTLTRSLLAENSPYYLAGGKVTYKPDEHWEYAAIVCNGWQRIKRVSNNSLPAFCTQVKYTDGNNLIMNWSTFIGTDDPDLSRRMRYFNNMYCQAQVSKRVSIIVGLDLGVQQLQKNSAQYALWYSPIVIARYVWTDQWSTSVRAEYYQDEDGVIIATGTPTGFKTTGLSLNLDYSPVKNLAWRIEGRWLKSADNIFQRQNLLVNDNIALVSSIAVSF